MFIKRITAMVLSIFFMLFISACSPYMDINENEENHEPNEQEATDSPEKTPNSGNNSQPEITAPETELQKKDQSEEVEMLQHAFHQIGYDITINGIYDELTTWAVTDFQLQHEDLMAIGIYDEETKAVLEQYIEDNEMVEPGLGLPFTEETVSTNSGADILANPYDQLALINKEYALPDNYEPEDLVIPNVQFPFTDELPKKQMREVAAIALEEMFQAADEAGLELYAQSGYRSFDRQEAIFAANVSANGEEEANKFSARPGESEHQSGLSMDITSPEVRFKLVVEFGETDEGQWILENAADYGFIIRYPEGKEDITKYQYEPWHLRYVGEKAAKEITENDITLEEYLLYE
ncbi:D-alanyl-D-alanine carboxypeptidase family protein [Oceanobacillus salinisoli]|uniref:D-alanyl-D-alanine carboxypeptidase family protein n=1 Tax=Oceanobacillus salinisoli TaxID=2678611 RepID=UPI001E5C921A|nr:D-alanyl-D-alanine carboxypeptidase family protein [Oceanobacillus salinisoli]